MGKKLTQEDFVSKAKSVHGGKYDYSKAEYSGSHAKVCVICPEHGEFWQRANGHLGGKGCPKCACQNNSQCAPLSRDAFIEKATMMHGGKYDYSKVEYVDNKTKICIICPIHGEFWQTPNGHLCGRGCRKCYESSKRKFGIGVYDVLGACRDDAPFYRAWCSIMLRATYDKHKQTHNAYKDCTICDEWLTLSNFKQWFEDPENGYQEGLHIDKDILVKGNKEYAPDTCCFVPREINSAIAIQPSGKFGVGVTPYGNKFEARLSRYGKRERVGLFDNHGEALIAYKLAKEQYVKELAESYFKEGKITERVYQALMKYEVEITD